MLHSISPVDYVNNFDHLNKLWHCCECNEQFVFGNGVVFLSHFRDRQTKEITLGLMCFCSIECGLLFEHPSFLGSA